MAMCCKRNSTFLIFAVLVCDVSRVAVKDFLNWNFFYIYQICHRRRIRMRLAVSTGDIRTAKYGVGVSQQSACCLVQYIKIWPPLLIAVSMLIIVSIIRL